ncbi:MAG: DUF488 domain-containing protein [Thermodesulfobacteriota bacterium]
MPDPMNTLYTIGHSTHSTEQLLHLLLTHRISAVADVRSSPFSRYNPQFNRENLQKALKDGGIKYVFLGKELGARSEDPACHEDGKVRFDRLAQTEAFRSGLARLRRGMESYRVVLLCAEKDPILCHRMILVCRNLRQDASNIQHILEDGSLEANAHAEGRLMKLLGIQENNLFATPEELTERAYDLQAMRIAYEEKKEE